MSKNNKLQVNETFKKLSQDEKLLKVVREKKNV